MIFGFSDHFEDPSAANAAESIPHSVLKQEEEDMQRAIAESEALARRQQGSGYVPANSVSNSGYNAGSGSQMTASQFFSSADGKALPDIQSQASTSSQGHNNQSYTSQNSVPGSMQQAQACSRVKALYDFDPQEDGELAFRRGDVIRVVNSAYEGWWKGELDGRIGIFPLTYIVSQFCQKICNELIDSVRKSFPILHLKH